MLQLADHRIVGSPVWRPFAYQYGGFWAGLLRDWQPNYAVQPALMFLTHGFLHADLAHLAGNVLALGPLGRTVIEWQGIRRFAAIYGAGALGGGAAFGLLSQVPAPMVGASGAIFGLAGALAARDWLERRSLARTAAFAFALAALNLATWLIMSGLVAWEAHLGGCLGGAAAALALGRPPPRGRPGQDAPADGAGLG